jgi:hypothetical protein
MTPEERNSGTKKYVSAAKHTYTTIQERLEAVFSLRSVLRLFSDSRRENLVATMSLP